MPWALAVFQYLTACGYDVFFDYISIPSGDFEKVIIENIKGRAHFVVILTPSALERCGEPGDWLRREIETAIDEKRNIVPLLVESFDFGSPGNVNALTGKLGSIQRYQGLRIPADFFFEAMDRLTGKFLNVSLDAVIHPISKEAVEATKTQQDAASESRQIKFEELSAQDWFERGYVYSTNGNFHEGLRCFSEAINLKPDFFEAFTNRGVTKAEIGDLDGAVSDYNISLEINQRLPATFNNRGLVFHRKFEYDKAAQDFRDAIRLDPMNAEIHCNLGLALNELGKVKEAIDSYNEAIRIDSKYVVAYVNRGAARYEDGDFDLAGLDFNDAIRLNPNSSDAYNNRGLVKAEKGDFAGAISDYDQAISFNPQNQKAFYNKGLSRKNIGDIEGSIKDFSEAINLKSDYAKAYFRRGESRKEIGDLDGAVEDLKMVVKIQKDFPNARKLLAATKRQRKAKQF